MIGLAGAAADVDRLGKLSPDNVLGITHLNTYRAIKWESLNHLHPRRGIETELPEIAQLLRITVADPFDNCAVTDLEVAQEQVRQGTDLTIRRRNRITVGIGRRVTQRPVDPHLELLRDAVLQA